MRLKKITSIWLSTVLLLGLIVPGATPLSASEDMIQAEDGAAEEVFFGGEEEDFLPAAEDGTGGEELLYAEDAEAAFAEDGWESDDEAAYAAEDLNFVEEAEEEELLDDLEEEEAYLTEGETLPDEAAAAPEEDAKERTFEEVLMEERAEAELLAEETLSDFRVSLVKKKSRVLRGVNIGAEEALAADFPSLSGDEALVGAGDLPEAFDLRKVDPGTGSAVSYVKKAKNQKKNGSCWAYAMTEAEESAAAAMRGTAVSGIDDSEGYLAYFAHSELYGEGALEYTSPGSGELINPFRAGGTTLEAAQLLTSAPGPAREDALPPIPVTEEAISAAAGSYTDAAFDDASLMADHLVTDVEFLPEPNLYDADWNWKGHDANAVLAIKESLVSGRAVAADIYYDNKSSAYISKAHDSVYVSDGSKNSTHQIAIIGWDDSFPASSFTSEPEGDGAWLCLNSWGNYEEDYKETCEARAEKDFETWKESYLSDPLHADVPEEAVTVDLRARLIYAEAYAFDEDGVFYLSYYDRVYHSPTSVRAEERSASAGETKTQYDYLGMSNCTSTGESEKSGTEANVFTFSEAQALTRIGVFTCEAMSHVKTDVYLLGDGAADPADGSRLLTEETDVRWAGYHLLPLSEQVTIPAGKSFSVVVTITGPKGTPYTPFEYGGTDPFYGEYVYVTEENEAGRSYILTDDGWVDLKDYPMDPQRFYLSGAAAGNALIRVFTKDAPEPEKEPEKDPEKNPEKEPETTPEKEPEKTPEAAPEKKAEEVPASVTGTSYAPLKLRAVSTVKGQISLKWAKPAGTLSGFTLYAAKSGGKLKKLKDFARTARSYKHKKLKAGIYEKYRLEAYALYGDRRVVTAKSPVIYAAVKGGDYTNAKSVKIRSAKKLTLKKGQTAKIRAEAVMKNKSLKAKTYKALRYASSNKAVASVTAKGKIKAKSCGDAVIYVYAQNGVYARVKVHVKK